MGKRALWKDMGILVDNTRIIKHPASEELLGDVPEAIKTADLILYYYVTGYYEGSGALLCRMNKEWFIHSLSHCSCYGPLAELYDSIYTQLRSDADKRPKTLTDAKIKWFANVIYNKELFEYAESIGVR